MPTGVYKHHPHQGFQKGYTPWNKKLFFSKGKLKKLYWKEKLSTRQIAKKFGITNSAILKWMKKFNIPRRNRSTAIKLNPPKVIPWCKGLSKETNEILKRNAKQLSQSRKGKNNPMYGKKYSKEWKIKQSKRFKKLIEEGKINPMKNHNLRPTKPEKRLIEILKKHNFPFKYVGNWSFRIGRKNPDFVHNNGKKLIEVFGRDFHSPLFTFKEKIPYHQTYQGTIKYYKKYGFDCLIIWDYELQNENLVIEKINSLIGKPIL